MILRSKKNMKKRKSRISFCKYPTGGFRTNKRYGVQVNEKEVDVGFMSLTTDNFQEAKRVYDSYN